MKSPNDIRAILFDKDGTLVDFQKTWFAIGDAMALEAAGGDRTRADALMQAAGYDLVAGRFRSDCVFASGTNADIVALWHPELNAAERRARIADFDRVTAREGAKSAVAIEGCAPALASLHGAGLKLGIATNDSTEGAQATLAALGVAQMFAAVYGYDAVARPKPAPDVVLAFADMTGLKTSQIAMAGDNRHDIDCGRTADAGLTVGVLSGTGTRETLARADVIIGSITELPALLGVAGGGSL